MLPGHPALLNGFEKNARRKQRHAVQIRTEGDGGGRNISEKVRKESGVTSCIVNKMVAWHSWLTTVSRLSHTCL